MADNKKLLARVPITPADFADKEDHKNHEMVMDYLENDIYVKEGDGYVSITGKIKEDIKEIKDASMVIHIVTEDSLPPIKDRIENHWYYVIKRSENAGSGSSISTVSYIYYGIIDSYSQDKNYILIAQNMIDGTDTVKIKVVENTYPVFYVPISMSAKFTNDETGEAIDYTIEDRIYTLNNEAGTFIAYDVYALDITTAGTYYITADISGTDYFTVSFDTNVSVAGLILPDPVKIHDGDSIGDFLPNEPYKTDARYSFQGWSTSKIAAVIISSTWKPEGDTTLYAWYVYDSDPTSLEYYSTYESTTEE